MHETNWQDKYRDRVGAPEDATKWIRPGNTVFIGTGCGEPLRLVRELASQAGRLSDVRVIHFRNAGPAPYAEPSCRGRMSVTSFHLSEPVRGLEESGGADYTPMHVSELPREIERGSIPIDVALIAVTPPDGNGLCSLGVAVDIVKAAAANAKYVVAQVNPRMPRTLGDCFVHIDSLDLLIPFEEPLPEVAPAEPDDVIRGIARNVARLVDDGATLHIGPGRTLLAVAPFLSERRDLGIHTEALGDWIVDLVEQGAVTCAKKSINRGRIVASGCMGTRRLYDFVDANPLFEFHPSDYVNDPAIIEQHEKMVTLQTGTQVDLTGQVSVESEGGRIVGGLGGSVDFVRGTARSRSGRVIVALPSTAADGSSAIRPRLAEGADAAIGRGDVEFVATEYGVANLRARSIRDRVLSLISIAHPKYRSELIHAAKAQKYIYQDQIEMSWDRIRYPEELEKYDTLRDGTQIFLRPVKPTDEHALAGMLYSLSENSLWMRYVTHTMAFPHSELQQLANVDYQQNMAVVGVVPGVPGEEIVAIAQYTLDPKTFAAQVYFLVQDEWQRKGMGTLLFRYLAEVARQRGVRRFVARVMPENRRMFAIVQNSGYEAKTEFDGTTHTLTCDVSKPK